MVYLDEVCTTRLLLGKSLTRHDFLQLLHGNTRNSIVSDVRDQVREDVERGIRAFEGNHRDRCISFLQRAADRLDEITDTKDRREMYSQLGTLFIQVNAPERALLAAQEAVALDRELGDRNLEGQDILLCGTAIGTLGNVAGALAAYREAREIFIEDENWANAASATTNIAVIIGQEDIDQGINLLEESLTYLERQAFPDTEVTTRIALIQALEVAGRPPERLFEVAEVLFEKFLQQLRPDQRENSVGPLEQAIARYMLEHPDMDPLFWKADRFPMLYG